MSVRKASGLGLILVVAVGGAAIGHSSLGAVWSGDASERGSALTEQIPAWMEAASVPGLAVAFADRDGVSFEATFGDGVDSETVFEAASLSKPVCAYLALQLAGQGRLDLDRPLSEIHRYADLIHDPRGLTLTPRMVLSHTSGLPNWRRGRAALDFVHDPGQQFQYSGEGFVYLQLALEELTGKSLESLARERIFGPFEMHRSSFLWNQEGSNVARGHSAAGRARDKRGIQSPNAAFSLHTTAGDYARFLSAMLRGDGLSPEILEQMITPQISVNPGVHWGLGWGLEDNEDGMSYWHWGHNGGYRAYTVSYPSRDFAVVYFTNSDNGLMLAPSLLAVATGEEDHPALRHLDYDDLDSPRPAVLRALRQTVLEDGVDAAVDKYHELKTRFPKEVFDESLLSELGEWLLLREFLEEGVEMYWLNAEMFPKSAGVHERLGDAYRAMEDPERALELYRESIQRERRPSVAEKIREIETSVRSAES